MPGGPVAVHVRDNLVDGFANCPPNVLLRSELTDTSDGPIGKRFWSQLSKILTKGFRKSGGYRFGPEALELGRAGMLYAIELPPPYELWTHADVEDAERRELHLPKKPKCGRLSLEETWKWLDVSGFDPPITADGKPRMCAGHPSTYSDPATEGGLGFFRTDLQYQAMDKLTLPRTYVGKTEVSYTSFKNSDLHESLFLESTFNDCDFTGADLANSRIAAKFVRSRFTDANLSGADLRWSQFESCSFKDASLRQTRLHHGQKRMIRLSPEQESQVEWMDEPDDEPEW
jgi:Uncharacterized low-complexity proteins